MRNEVSVTTAGRADAASAPGRPRVWPGWLIAAIPALAELIIGGYKIAGPSLWRDEAATISGSARPVSAIWRLVQAQDAVHGPYYLLMHFVIAAGGSSETVLRLPSLLAMAAAVGMTAVLGRRLARAAGLPAPDITGIAAGLLLAAVPLSTRYAQEARPYALATLFAVLATYLLVRAAAGGRRIWWVGYAAALVLAGLFNLFAVLIAVCHGISLLAARTGGRDGDPAVRAGAFARWLVSCAVSAVLLLPLLIKSAEQSGQLAWVGKPNASSIASLIRDFSGATLVIPIALGLAVLGCVAGTGLRRGRGLTLAVIALPWLLLPPAGLIAVSLAHPVYVQRYVVFCLPAASLLVAAGLSWLVRLCRDALPARRWLAAAPAAVLAVVIVAGLAGPQAQIRQPGSRADNLRAVASVLAANERPGDAIEYLPWTTRMVGMAYPRPFQRLDDVELGGSPIASNTLRGVQARPAEVAARLRGITRIWTVRWVSWSGPQNLSRTDRLALSEVRGMRAAGRWRISSVILTLYVHRGT